MNRNPVTEALTFEPYAEGPVTWTWEAETGTHVLKIYATTFKDGQQYGWQILTRSGYLLRSNTATSREAAEAEALNYYNEGRLEA